MIPFYVELFRFGLCGQLLGAYGFSSGRELSVILSGSAPVSGGATSGRALGSTLSRTALNIISGAGNSPFASFAPCRIKMRRGNLDIKVL